MSCYLMSDTDTIILAAWGYKNGLFKNAKSAASVLRSANNAALFVRYGDKPKNLNNLNKIFSADSFEQIFNSINIFDIADLADKFRYQCCEGEVWETHKGCQILRKIIFKSNSIIKLNRVY